MRARQKRGEGRGRGPGPFKALQEINGKIRYLVIDNVTTKNEKLVHLVPL